MGRTREIKKRMGAVANIQRITKTMQMIATAKFTAAVQRTTAARPFAEKIRQLVGEVAAAAGDVEHPLLGRPADAARTDLVLVISSDRGLCGAYNSNVLRNAVRSIHAIQETGREVILETSGKKAVGFFKFQKLPISERHFLGDKPAYEEVARIADRYIEEYIQGRFDSVSVASMRYVSNARQVPEILRLMPLQPAVEKDEHDRGGATYEFSPSSAELLGALVPLAIKTSLFQAFNDAVVSEQIMRMVAMKAATENAKDLGRLLKRQFNRARQSQITTELMEVIAGSSALE
jgi:F-type H+-transporting ATPase subunit gamma